MMNIAVAFMLLVVLGIALLCFTAAGKKSHDDTTFYKDKTADELVCHPHR